MPAEVGDAFSQLISDQLVEERARKTSLEQRGVGVITTSGALVTLLFGLSALVSNNQQWVLPDYVRPILALAVLLFLVASVLGLATNWTLSYIEVESVGMRDLATPGHWQTVPAEAARLAAEARIDIIEGFRSKDEIKAWVLRAAIGAEIAAVGVVAIAVWMVLAST